MKLIHAIGLGLFLVASVISTLLGMTGLFQLTKNIITTILLFPLMPVGGSVVVWWIILDYLPLFPVLVFGSQILGYALMRMSSPKSQSND